MKGKITVAWMGLVLEGWFQSEAQALNWAKGNLLGDWSVRNGGFLVARAS